MRSVKELKEEVDRDIVKSRENNIKNIINQVEQSVNFAKERVKLAQKALEEAEKTREEVLAILEKAKDDTDVLLVKQKVMKGNINYV